MPKTLGDARQKALVTFIKMKRKEAGLNQVDVAKRLKVQQSLVARVESGQRRIDVVEFIQLADILDFDPSEAIRDLMSVDPKG
ncbi:helix-turn-helix transcriptional regulator [Pseudophaeobacter sp.]|uniref:helix-turn-helix domain-containing protein n=1 Tax=Pseudophaeobacter sp. TaxID=1971739 RepID=UPI003299697B